jgi:hypothetical protein
MAPSSCVTPVWVAQNSLWSKQKSLTCTKDMFMQTAVQ